MKELIKEFTEKYCRECNSYIFCAGEMVLSCRFFSSIFKRKEIVNNNIKTNNYGREDYRSN